MTVPQQLRELTLEITNRCLNRCLTCSSNSEPRPDAPHLEHYLVRSLLEQASELGVEHVYLSGGEPFLHPDFDSILADATRLLLPGRVSVYTSGVTWRVSSYGEGPGSLLLTADQESLLKAGRVPLVFNVYSHLPYVHNFLASGDDRLRATQAAMQNCLARGLIVRAHMVVTRLNHELLLESACRYAMAGVPVKMLRFVAQGRGDENRELLELNHAARVSVRAANLMPEDSDVDSVDWSGVPWQEYDPATSDCGACRGEKLVVLPSGRAAPCEGLKDSVQLGSVLTSTLAELQQLARQQWEVLSNVRLAVRSACPAQACTREEL
jgi:MoaA/NifB/PqqE/SkfB family radical SAM enzyme